MIDTPSRDPAIHESAAPSGYSWQRIRELAWAHKQALIAGHAIALAATLLTVPIPLLMPLLVDEVLLDQPAVLVDWINAWFPSDWHGPTLYILAVLGLIVGLRVLGLALSIWQNRQFARISKDVVFRIRGDLIDRLQWVSMAEYETLGSGKVNSHLVTDLDTLDQFLGAGLSKLLVSVLSLIAVAGVLLLLHWQLALIILVLYPLVLYLTNRLGRRVKGLKAKENEAYATFQEQLQETLDGMQQLRAHNREGFYLDRIRVGARKLRDHAIEHAWRTEAANRFSLYVFVLGLDGFRTLTMFMVLFSGLSVGEMIAVLGYLWFMIAPVQEMIDMQYDFHDADAALQRVNALFALRREPEYAHRQNPFSDSPTAAISLENVSFAYPGHDKKVLDAVSLHIAAGEKVALVGASGGGKTTLVQVLLGLYPPQAGQVRFNDVAVTDIGLDVVREHVATVLQHPALFNDSLRMNLTLGRDLPEEQLWQALQIARLQDVVEDLEHGLDTVIGRDGVRLSGGQRQRVAVARMILANPKVVILDEATSALDTETETLLHQGLQTFLSGKTTLVIAHRPSAVRQADRILVFDQGKIVEQGKRAELLRQDGIFARLYGEVGW